MDVLDIKRAYLAGKNVPARQTAAAIMNDPELFYTFLIDNNPEVVNRTLRVDLGYRELPFVPDRKAIGAMISNMISKKDFASLNVIARRYEFNKHATNYTVNAELLTELKPHLQKHV